MNRGVFALEEGELAGERVSGIMNKRPQLDSGRRSNCRNLFDDKFDPKPACDNESFRIEEQERIEAMVSHYHLLDYHRMIT